MKHFIYLVLAVIMLASCAGPRIASTVSDSRDSTRVSAQQLDSLYRQLMQRDSIYHRDSIYIREKGDTVTCYIERTRYAYKLRTDTLYRTRIKCDTIYVERTDSVKVTQPVYIEKPVKWYDAGAVWLGRLCIITLILWAVFLYLKRKF